MAGKRTYNETEREHAVATAALNGLADASRELDIPKSTIKSWAKARGVDVADEKLQAKVERATTMSVAMRAQRLAEAKERTVLLLAAIMELGAHRQIEILRHESPTMVEAVGATTRAIHDMQLLTGDPTEITEELDSAAVKRLRDELQARISGAVVAAPALEPEAEYEGD